MFGLEWLVPLFGALIGGASRHASSSAQENALSRQEAIANAEREERRRVAEDLRLRRQTHGEEVKALHGGRDEKLKNINQRYFGKEGKAAPYMEDIELGAKDFNAYLAKHAKAWQKDPLHQTEMRKQIRAAEQQSAPRHLRERSNLDNERLAKVIESITTNSLLGYTDLKEKKRNEWLQQLSNKYNRKAGRVQDEYKQGVQDSAFRNQVDADEMSMQAANQDQYNDFLRQLEMSRGMLESNKAKHRGMFGQEMLGIADDLFNPKKEKQFNNLLSGAGVSTALGSLDPQDKDPLIAKIKKLLQQESENYGKSNFEIWLDKWSNTGLGTKQKGGFGGGDGF